MYLSEDYRVGITKYLFEVIQIEEVDFSLFNTYFYTLFNLHNIQ